MKKMTFTTESFLAAALLTVAAGPALAAVPFSFTSGDLIKSGEMNTNFSTLDTDIGNNTTAINANTTAIGSNTTAISNNATAIADNATRIGAVTSDMCALYAQLDSTASIGTLQVLSLIHISEPTRLQ